MYGGFRVPNKSHAMGSGKEFHVGPHIMITGPDQKMLETLNHDGSNGEPYVNHLPGRTELYLVIPIREWDDAQAVALLGQHTDSSRPVHRWRSSSDLIERERGSTMVAPLEIVNQ